MLLSGKTAVITGCSRGIGRATLVAFANNGANVWAHFREPKEEYISYCKDLEKSMNVIIRPFYFDITNEDEMKAEFKRIKADMDRIDILVNNAGIGGSTNVFQMTSINEMRNVMEVNFYSAMRITQFFIKYMIKQKNGSIINLSSVAGLYGEPSMLPYVASKGAIASSTKKLASEYGIYGIRVNAVAPGVTKTEMTDAISADYKRRITDETMLGRLAEPEEIANVILFLGSDLSAYITGQVIEVNGGLKL